MDRQDKKGSRKKSNLTKTIFEHQNLTEVYFVNTTYIVWKLYSIEHLKDLSLNKVENMSQNTARSSKLSVWWLQNTALYKLLDVLKSIQGQATQASFITNQLDINNHKIKVRNLKNYSDHIKIKKLFNFNIKYVIYKPKNI